MITSHNVPTRTWLYKHKPTQQHAQVNPDPEPELLTAETDTEEWLDWEDEEQE